MVVSRKVGNKEQKIILTGDADYNVCRNSDEDLGIRTATNFVTTGSFFWMDNEVPIDVRRPALPDDKVYVEKPEVR